MPITARRRQQTSGWCLCRDRGIEDIEQLI
jgi:hypothetical protein